ncbi:MAG: alpha/beta fold hydrolase [Halobacteriota archaeon]
MAVKEKRIPIDGAEIYVRREGRGKPIVLVHGIALNSDMWRYQVPYLKQRGYEVISMDLRGFGRSHHYKDDKPADYTYERWAKDLGRVLQAFHLRHVTLVGYSMGGAIAMQYMLHSNWRVDKFILVAAAGPYLQEDLPFPDDHRLRVTRAGIKLFVEMLEGIDQLEGDDLIGAADNAADEAFEHFLRIAFPTVRHADFPDGIDGLEWLKEMFHGCSYDALIGGLNQMHDVQIPLDVGSIDTPTTICHGLLDLFVPFGLGEYQQELINKAHLEPIMGGHGLFFEKAGELNRALTGAHVRRVPECPLYFCPVRWFTGTQAESWRNAYKGVTTHPHSRR